MNEQYEIEFKNSLTKEQYENLLKKFAVPEEDIVRQTNHYFDTDEWHLKNLAGGLRIRETNNRIVCTLKVKTDEHTHLETTDTLTKEERDDMLNSKGFYAPTVKARLLELNVPIDRLRLLGTLTTDRVELPYEGGLLVFDHSFYLDQDDYEVEFEANDAQVGQEIFLQFLKKHDISVKAADKKIARFMKALKEKKGEV